MGGHKDGLNVMMCKMRKMSPSVEGGRGRWKAAIWGFDVFNFKRGRVEGVAVPSGKNDGRTRHRTVAETKQQRRVLIGPLSEGKEWIRKRTVTREGRIYSDGAKDV